jgi:GntR family transcriptional regulator/MocR family aminotransferase
MSREGSSAPLLALAVDRSDRRPLQRQIYDQVREAVLARRLPPGRRLPSTRALAGELACARNTVTGAFEQLLAEGYLEGRVGSGTYVSSVLPDHLLAAARPATSGPQAEPSSPPVLSRRGAALAALRRPVRRAGLAFVHGVPDLSEFPFDVWGRLLGRVWRRPTRALLAHGEPAGFGPLRTAIARYLGAARALDCQADQVLITSGAQQALDLAVRVLLDPGEAVWMEDPGYPGLLGPVLAAGLRAVPVPVDAQGLSVQAGRGLAPEARLAVATPSHQHPLGITMSLGRRLELLDWARESSSWVLEDDYDSEYRYAGRPLASLQGLDAARPDGGCVLYVGSFSKVLFPSLRLGYLVVPRPLVAAFAAARGALDDHPSAIAQPALAAFIEDGHFAAHVRRMRTRYQARQTCLLNAADRHLNGLLEFQPDESGMHLVARLAPPLARRLDDRQATTRAAAAGITVSPLSSYFQGPATRQGLLIGYAAVPEAEIEAGVKALAGALRS